MVKASYLHCIIIIIILFYMSYLPMVNRTCSKPKLLKEADFSPLHLDKLHQNTCQLQNVNITFTKNV